MKTQCSMPECERPCAGNGLCDTHYRRWRKHGDANVNHSVKHGMYGSSTYVSWRSMIARCCNSKHKAYRNYGGRGITVCERWRNSFTDFLADMGERPEGTTLDRKENNGNYEPGNCRWATPKEQTRNRRVSVRLRTKGKEVLLVDAADAIGVRPGTLRARLRRGWSAHESLTIPVVATSDMPRNWHGQLQSITKGK